MSDRLERIAVVTGATSGIGEATARRFVAAGFGVAGNGRNAPKLSALEREMGPAFAGVAGDAADPDVLSRLFATALERFGSPADIVVANAGRGLGGSVTEADITQFDSLVRVNVSAVLTLLQMAAQRMTDLKAARPDAAADIVVTGSVVGRHISPFSAVYGASKFAVHALTEGLRREIGPRGIRVSLVEPGLVKSGFQAAAGYSREMVANMEERFGPALVPDDVAKAVLFMVTQPPHVHVADLVVRPTRQDYP